MDEKLKGDHPATEENRDPAPGRRQLLKMMTVSAGVVGIPLLLPVQWTRPVIEFIVLPAHAATSGTPEQAEQPGASEQPEQPGASEQPAQPGNDRPVLGNFSIGGWRRSRSLSSRYDSRDLMGCHAQLSYEDELCEVDPESTSLQYTISNGGELDFPSGAPVGKIKGAELSGSACTGELGFNFITNANAYGETLNINLEVSGRSSNWLSATIQNQS